MYGNYGFDAPEALKSVLEGFSIHPGDRGEVVVLLLLCLARDLAVKRAPSDSRIVTVSQFMENLLKDNALKTHKPSVWTERTRDETFQMNFGDSWIHCTHFIKVHEHKLINRKYLWALMFRAAGIICGNGQAGVDVIIPYLYKCKVLRRLCVGSILIQVKNDRKFTGVPDEDLFLRMDPQGLGMFDVGEQPVPVIRILFALAAAPSSLTYMKPSKSASTFTSYDFWCAGINPDVLVPVTLGKLSTWAALLQASRPWQAVYTGEKEESTLKRSSNPGAGTNNAHWAKWVSFGAAEDIQDDFEETSDCST